MQASIFRLLKIPTIWKVILALLALELVVLVEFYSVERWRLRAVEKQVTYGNPDETKHFWKFEMPGLQSPPALPATASKIADDDEVIGVVVSGKPRAYWLKALKYPPWHIVNDVVAGVPVSVTHCDRTNCTRVYTSADSSTPLDLNLGGLYGKEMVVEVGGALYLQETGEPFEAGAGVPTLPYTDRSRSRGECCMSSRDPVYQAA
jgi:Protein of unknown function (DUF3179)